VTTKRKNKNKDKN